MDKTADDNELYEVNDIQYKGSIEHPALHQLVEVSSSHIGLTDSNGNVIVKIEYMPNDGAFDIEDGCFPIWYDATGNQIGLSGTKTQTPPELVE